MCKKTLKINEKSTSTMSSSHEKKSRMGKKTPLPSMDFVRLLHLYHPSQPSAETRNRTYFPNYDMRKKNPKMLRLGKRR